jgi:hypothetical protein
MDERWKPMNELQQLIADYIADNPGESYASIGRRGGLPRQTVQHLAKKAQAKQTPHPETLRCLAAGMGLPESYVRAAAADAAGYKGNGGDGITDQRGRLIVEAVKGLDPERLESLARRARSLLSEMRDEQEHGSRNGRDSCDPGE